MVEVDYDTVWYCAWHYVVDEDGDATIVGWEPSRGLEHSASNGYHCTVRVPSELAGYPVTYIGPGAFTECELCYGSVALILPASINEVGDDAFNTCHWLASIELGEGVIEIGDLAFADCDALERIEISEGVTTLGVAAFQDCRTLVEAVLPSTLTDIPDMLFLSCEHLERVELREGLENIGESAFENCYYLSLKELPEGVLSIGAYAFEGTNGSLEERFLRLPESLEEIGERAFAYVGYDAILVPEGVVDIGANAFWYGDEMDPTVVVCERGSYAEAWCKEWNHPFSLTPWEVYIERGDLGHTEDDSGFVFDVFEDSARVVKYVAGDAVAHVPDYVFGAEVFSVGEGCFENNVSLREVVLPSTVTQILDAAFYGCLNLERLVVHASDGMEIADDALALCDDVCVVCAEGSFAWRWCERRGTAHQMLPDIGTHKT